MPPRLLYQRLCLQLQVCIPGLGVWPRKRLALLVTGLLLARHTALPRVAAHLRRVTPTAQADSIELAPLGITINNIAPGAIETPINTKLLNDPVKLNALLGNIPLKRLGTPGDMAGAALFLASPLSAYILGQTLIVDGGLML